MGWGTEFGDEIFADPPDEADADADDEQEEELTDQAFTADRGEEIIDCEDHVHKFKILHCIAFWRGINSTHGHHTPL